MGSGAKDWRRRGGDRGVKWDVSSPTFVLAVPAISSAAIGLVLLAEDRGGYIYPVFAGPKAVFSWTGVDPLTVWGAVYLACAALIMCGVRRLVILGMLILIPALGIYGGSSLRVGLSETSAASTGGVLYLALAFSAMQRLLVYTSRAKRAPPEPSR